VGGERRPKPEKREGYKTGRGYKVKNKFGDKNKEKKKKKKAKSPVERELGRRVTKNQRKEGPKEG